MSVSCKYYACLNYGGKILFIRTSMLFQKNPLHARLLEGLSPFKVRTPAPHLLTHGTLSAFCINVPFHGLIYLFKDIFFYASQAGALLDATYSISPVMEHVGE